MQGLGGDAVGVAMFNTSVTGTISNTGQIVGNSDGVVAGEDSSINSLTNTNLISGTSYAGVLVEDSGYVGVINNGSRAVTTTSSGTVYTTQAAASISGATSGIEVRNSDVNAIVNTGVIQGGGTLAGIFNERGSIGSVINTAQTYTNTTAAGTMTTTSVVTLVGSISGGDYGIKNKGDATVSSYIDTISNTGLIRGNLTGIYNDGGDIGSITNATQVFSGSTVIGQITGEDHGIASSGDTASVGLINNSGHIQATKGIYTDRGTLGAVVNTGTIIGSGVGEVEIGIDLNSTHIQSGVTNAGLISGDWAGIQFDGAQNSANVTTSTTLWGTTASPNNFTFSSSADCLSMTGTACSTVSSTSVATTFTPSVLPNLVNQESGTITAGSYGIRINSGTVASLSNEGLIARLPGASEVEPVGISIARISKFGSAGILNEGTIGSLSNSGTIGVAGTAPSDTEEPVLITALAEVSEEVAEQRFNVGIGNDGTINTLNNTGVVLALNQGISNSGAINTLNNGEDGSVSGQLTGVYTNELISNFSNTGLIEGVTYSGIENAGTINSLYNYSGATIKGGEDGVYNYDKIGQISNTGLITGVSSQGISNSGTIDSLTNFGSITGASNGIMNSGTIDSLSNSGLISGTYAGIASYGSIDFLSVGEDGQVVGGQDGVSNSGTIGNLSNSGLIQGTTQVGVINNGVIESFYNGEDGTVMGGEDGVYNTSTIGSLSNSGLISGTTFAGISNSGTIGTLSNTGGSISGGSAGVFNSGTVTLLSNTGLIDGRGTATGVYNTGTIAGLANNGTINGGAATGVFTRGTIASLSNTGTITAGTYGIYNNDGTIGNITNAGLIDSTGAGDIAINNAGTITGGIDNSGTVAGTISNSSFIFSGSRPDAIYNTGSIAAIHNTVGGVISSNDHSGIHNDHLLGSISNSGLIESEESAIYNNGTLTSLVNASGGTITGGEDGIVNDYVITSISNSGLIEGEDFSGMYNGGTIDSLINASSGTFTGGDNGIWNEGAIGSLNNSGLIRGFSEAGIDNAATITSVTNHAGGTIAGDYGVDNTGTIGTLNNSGLVSGEYDGVYNGGEITDLTNTTSGVISGGDSGVYNSGKGGTIGTLNNAGLIAALGSGEDAVYNNGTIGSLINTGVIKAGGFNSVETLGEDNVGYAIYNDGTITNGITNTGTLQGHVFVGFDTLNLRGTTAKVQGNVTGFGQVLVGTGEDAAYFTTEGNISVSGGVSVTPNAVLALHDGARVGNSLVNNGKVFVDDGDMATVTGAYQQNGVLSVGATSASNYGQLTVTGAATLSSTASFDVDVKTVNTLAIGETLHNVLSAGTLTGTSANDLEVTDNSFLLEFDSVHDGNTVDLNVTYSGIGAAMQTLGFTPGTGAGNALDSILNECLDSESESAVCGTLSGFLNEMLQQGSGAGVANLVGQALPLMQSNMQLSLLGAQQQITNLIEQRQVGGQASGDGWLTQRQMWFKPLASRLEQDDVGGVAGYRANTGGFVLGAEGSLDATNRLGLALAYTNTRVKGQTTTMTHDAKFDGYQLIAYGTSAMPIIGQGVDLNWQADVGFGTTKGRRSAFNGVANSDYKTHSLHVGAGLSKEMPLGDGLSITPLVRADYTTLRDKAYTETGTGALTLVVNKRTTDQFIVSAGAKLNKKLDSQWLLTGSANLGVDLINEASVLAARFTAGGPLFSTTGIKPKAWVGGLGLNLQYKPSETVTWDFGYDMSTRSNYTDQTLSVKIKWAF